MQFDQMKRREFISLLSGAAAAWPLAARAQQGERVRRIGVLMSLAADDKEAQARLAAFLQGLQELGWIDGRNVRIDIRWRDGDADRNRRHAAELLALAPDVILASGGSVVGTLLQATSSVPIVFTQTPDPVGAGFVESLARPGGNATGFSIFDYSIGGKWLELLKQIAPGMTRVAVIWDPATPQGIGQFSAIQSLAPLLSLEVTPVHARDASEIERTIAAVQRNPNSGLIVTGSNFALAHRELIVTLAARYKLPAVYPLGFFVTAGGLISYGPDGIDPHRRAAAYVDRILKGEKPADLPVQAPTKYELMINLKTAKALGLDVPDSILTRADEVIE
jgi:putative tryptophan/tyrosine transport system substrate-binding protein